MRFLTPEQQTILESEGTPMSMKGTRYAQPYCPHHPWMTRKRGLRWFCLYFIDGTTGKFGQGATWTTSHFKVDMEAER